MERQKARSRKKKTFGRKGWAAAGCCMAALLFAAGLIYGWIGKQYRQVFFPGTVINGLDASKKTVEEVKKMISSEIDGYVLRLKERDGRTEELLGSQIGLEAVFDGSLEALLEAQRPMEWIRYVRKPRSFDIDTMIQYDAGRFEAALAALKCFQEDLIEKPENAYISDYVSGQGYYIVPAREGNQLDENKAREEISQAVLTLKPELSFEELEAYIPPEISGDDAGLIHQVQTRNKYVNTVITYTFGDVRQTLNGDTISKWIGTDENGEPYVSSQEVAAYVKELASEYDTYNKAKVLKTSYGQNVRITGGSYGWRIDQAAEADELAALIRSGQSQVREPIYKQKGASRGGTDYGTTYVEINLTAQHLYFYKEGKLVVESDFVSGNEAKGWSTPAGVYSLTYKQRDAVLKGENYRTPVDYWMPFNGGIGLHDAAWRSAFGGTIYKTNGSHGCINLPPAVAKTIYENICAGVPVLCYHLAGTESKETSGQTQGGRTEETKAPSEETPKQTQAQTTEASAAAPETTAAAPETSSAASETSPAKTQTQEPFAASDAESPSSPEEIGPGMPGRNSEKEEIGPGVKK